MIDRPEANIHLMEELYDSAIPELLHVNTQAVNEATRMDELNHPDAPEYLDLALVPDFMKDKDGRVRDTESQREIATEVLTGLHEAWNGSEALEHRVNPHLTEQYWEFTRGFTSWTVVELHYAEPVNEQRASVSAYLLRDKRPAAYQKMLTEKIHEQEELEEKAEAIEQATEPKMDEAVQSSRRARAGKAISKWLKDQAKQQPPRYNRFE
jgi:hypothetical protein